MNQPIQVVLTIGVDTHAEAHVAVALDNLGRRVGTYTLPTTEVGYAGFLRWASQLGKVDTIGMEGTGSYGAGLSRWLRGRGLTVVEVERPKRPARRGRGKSDPIDAELAQNLPSTGDGAFARRVLAASRPARDGWPTYCGHAAHVDKRLELHQAGYGALRVSVPAD